MRKVIREQIESDKPRKRHNAILNLKSKKQRLPPGFNHMPTDDEIEWVRLSLMKKYATNNDEIKRLSFPIETKMPVKKQDKALEQLVDSLYRSE